MTQHQRTYGAPAAGTSDLVGASPLHLSGREHVTGRSRFIDDLPKPRGLLIVKVSRAR